MSHGITRTCYGLRMSKARLVESAVVVQAAVPGERQPGSCSQRLETELRRLSVTKKGTSATGVGRKHAGITGQVENCQTVVFAAYVTARGHALSDFRLYLPEQWCADQGRRERAHVPDGTVFTTRPALGTEMITGAAGARIP